MGAQDASPRDFLSACYPVSRLPSAGSPRPRQISPKRPQDRPRGAGAVVPRCYPQSHQQTRWTVHCTHTPLLCCHCPQPDHCFPKIQIPPVEAPDIFTSLLRLNREETGESTHPIRRCLNQASEVLDGHRPAHFPLGHTLSSFPEPGKRILAARRRGAHASEAPLSPPAICYPATMVGAVLDVVGIATYVRRGRRA